MTEKTAKQIFNEALDLIRDPKRWTQMAMARDLEGLPTDPRTTNAVCWCSVGALDAVMLGVVGSKSEVEVALNYAAAELGYLDIVSYNDTQAASVRARRTHSEVIALWEKVGREQGWME